MKQFKQLREGLWANIHAKRKRGEKMCDLWSPRVGGHPTSFPDSSLRTTAGDEGDAGSEPSVGDSREGAGE